LLNIFPLAPCPVFLLFGGPPRFLPLFFSLPPSIFSITTPLSSALLLPFPPFLLRPPASLGFHRNLILQLFWLLNSPLCFCPSHLLVFFSMEEAIFDSFLFRAFLIVTPPALSHFINCFSPPPFLVFTTIVPLSRLSPVDLTILLLFTTLAPWPFLPSPQFLL